MLSFHATTTTFLFINNQQGGVHVAEAGKAKDCAEKMLGNKLITKQTAAGGAVVRKLYISEAVDIEKELYLAMMLDRGSGGPVVIGRYGKNRSRQDLNLRGQSPMDF